MQKRFALGRLLYPLFSRCIYACLLLYFLSFAPFRYDWDRPYIQTGTLSSPMC